MPGGRQDQAYSQDVIWSASSDQSLQSDEFVSEKCKPNIRQIDLDPMPIPWEEGKPSPPSCNLRCWLTLQGKHLRPSKKSSKIHLLHSYPSCSRSLDLQESGRGGFSELSFTYHKSLKKSCSQITCTDGEMARMTLGGVLVNVDDGISGKMGEILGLQETAAWNGFAPLQKVLLVAITAAAASAARQRNTNEMRCLQLAIDARDKDSEILRERISQLQEHLSYWKEKAQNFREEAREERVSPVFSLGLESTPRCNSTMLEQFATPQTEHVLQRMPDHITCLRRNLRPATFKMYNERWAKGVSNLDAIQDKMNEVTFSDRLSELSPLSDGQLTQQMPWTQLKSIFTPSNNVSPKQVDHISQYCQKGCRKVDFTEGSLKSCVTSLEFMPELKKQLSESQSMIIESHNRVGSKEGCLQESDQSQPNSYLNSKEHKLSRKENNYLAIPIATRNTVNGLSTPSSESHHPANWTYDLIIEQLFGELNNAAAKVASMEAEIKSLKDKQELFETEEEEAERHLAESEFQACKELETTLELLKDTEKRLATCSEACQVKDKAILRLEDEVASLQETVAELRSLNGTPMTVGQQKPSPVQTFLTSNLLFNLDSPVKMDSPVSVTSSFSSWKCLDELSQVSDSLDRESRDSMRGSCDSEIYKLQCAQTCYTDGNKKETEGSMAKLREGSATFANKHVKRETVQDSWRNRSKGEASSSSSSGNEPVRRSNSSSSSSMDESNSGPFQTARLKGNGSHARNLKVSNALDPQVNGGRSNVLAGVEPNTPMRNRKSNGGSGKDKILSGHSLDSLKKAKENLALRRRWV